MSISNEYVRRIAVMGFRAVGKSSLTIQFVERQFVDQYLPTIENTFNAKLKTNGTEFSLKIVDTSGQDEFSIIPNNLCLGVHGYVLVYSVTNRNSFDIAKIIRDKILNLTGTGSVPIVLVGNKKDLHVDRDVSTQEGEILAKEWGCPFFETSAKEDDHVQTVFSSILKVMENPAQLGRGSEQEKKDCVIL